MAKDLKISILLDIYGSLLTEKQQEVVALYYDEDLSLAEIAEHAGITRQGVRDCIKRAEYQLLECEDKLGHVQRFREIQEKLDDIIDGTRRLQQDVGRYSTQLAREVERIREAAESISL